LIKKLKKRKQIPLVRTLALAILPAFLVFSVVSIFIYIGESNKLINTTEKQIKNDLTVFNSLLEYDFKNNKEYNINALHTFRSVVLITDYFKYTNTFLDIDATDFYTNTTQKIKIWNITYKDNLVTNNSNLFKNLSLSLNSELGVAVKTKKGYVIINSTLNDFNFKLFPFSSDIITTIEDNEEYNGLITINEKVYHISAAPFYIGGKINGFFLSLKPKIYSRPVRRLFLQKKYLKRGYAFALDKKGILQLHPNLENTSIVQSRLFKKIISLVFDLTPVRIEYIWPEDKNGEKKVMYTIYNKNINLYIGVCYYNKDLNQSLRRLIIRLIIAILFSTFFYSIIFYFVIYRLVITIQRMRDVLFETLNGNYNNIINITKNKYELKLFEKFSNLEEFTKSLKNKDFDFEYEKWGDNDTIGDNLITLKDNLLVEAKAAAQKLKEQDKLIWLNEGLSKFIEILKYQVIEIKDLAYKIISQIVSYVGADEGGFFIVTVEGNGNKYLELLAAFASSKEKLLERKIKFGAGLIGRVAIEKKMLFITEVPDEYFKISTSLGNAKPQSIILLPLLFNEEIIGVIELASIKVFTDLEIEFLKRISENISANLAMWRASQQTSMLLKETREQARKMQKQQKDLEKHIKELDKLREESEKREIELNSIIKAVDTSALLVEFDTNGYITSVNNRFLSTLEKKNEEIINKHHGEITTLKTQSKEYKTFWEDLLNGKPKRFIESFSIQDKTVWLSQNYVPILDKEGKVFKILNIAIDITENKLMEKQLRAQVKEISKEARLVRKEQRKIAIERKEFEMKEMAYISSIKILNKFIGHIEFNIEGKISFANTYLATKLEYQNSSFFIDKNIKDIIVPNELEKFKMALETLNEKKEYSDFITMLNTSSKEVVFEYSMVLIADNENKPVKIIMALKHKKN